MSYKAELLQQAFESEICKSHFKAEGRGLTFEDYWIYVCIIGHQNYRMYNDAHWRDSDIIDKTDVWKKIQSDNAVEKRAEPDKCERSGYEILGGAR